MAILRGVYLTHLRGVCHQALLNANLRDQFLRIMMVAGVDYVKAGSPGAERASRREAVQIFITLAYQVMGKTHNPHMIKHDMIDAGVLLVDADDIPAIEEPA